jgi:hypothetical protein
MAGGHECLGVDGFDVRADTIGQCFLNSAQRGPGGCSNILRRVSAFDAGSIVRSRAKGIALSGLLCLGFVCSCSPEEQCPVVWRTANVSVGWSNRHHYACLEHAGKLWVLAGDAIDTRESRCLNDVWVSDDGLSWRMVVAESAWRPRLLPACFSFQGKLWLAGGLVCGWREQVGKQAIDVWNSEDGALWRAVGLEGPGPVQSDYMSCVYEGRIWLLEGTGSGRAGPKTVWSSSDGARWQLHTDRAPWSGVNLLHRTCVVHREKMVVVDSDVEGTRVWTSSDGKDWALVAEKLAWGRRTGFACVSHQGRIWLLGGEAKPGQDIAYETNDVWCSEDGVEWGRQSRRVPWCPRTNATAVSFEGKLWLFGGAERQGFLRDLWWAESK